ncbi:MAG: hypothetical protein HQK53_11570 [Oligoflexia bacterium]|nr:hypothetical protein [Oligoflexia bacterium]
MNKFNKDQIIEVITSAIDRFIGEMAPYWSKENFIKLINPPGYEHEISEQVIQDALNTLEQNKIIIRVSSEECYFIVSEDMVEKYYDGEFRKILIDQVNKLRIKFNV